MKFFTLIEILIVTLIIAVTLIPLFSLMQEGNKIIYQSENNLKASNLCSEGLEWFISNDFQKLYTMSSGDQINGMFVVQDGVSINDEWWTLKNFKAVIPKTGSEETFEYSGEFGGEGTVTDKDAYRDFKRVGIIKKHDDNTLELKVIVRWSEMGKKDSFRERVLSRILCRQSLKF